MLPGVVQSETMTAAVVMANMGERDRYNYVAGIVEGLAYARYVADNKSPDGMACIYRWFHEDDATIDRIHQAFGRFGDYPPAAVVSAMAGKECGK